MWIFKNVSAISIRKHQEMQKPISPTVISVRISSLGILALSCLQVVAVLITAVAPFDREGIFTLIICSLL